MNTVTLHFKADNQQLTALDGLYKLASNTVEYVKAVFTLGENWTGFDVVRAAWYTDFECISTVLDGNGECFVPWEVLSRPEGVTLNLYGCDLEEESDGEAVLIDRLTTYPVKAILVDVDARVCGSETKPVTPSQFEQYIAIVEGIVHSVKDIDHTELNADYTLTIYYTDGTSDTVGPIRGEQGPVGPTGNGISKIEKVGTAGLVDTYRITYTNGQTYEYTVTNGAQGPQGNGIVSIYKSGESGAVKTYTILFTDGNTFEYQVTDGEVTFATLEQLMPKDTASGDIASFPDGQAVFPLKSCVVNIEPVQAGSGTPSPDNVRPITGWTGCEVNVTARNLFGGEYGELYPLHIAKGTEIVASGVNSSSVRTRINFYDENKNFIDYYTLNQDAGNGRWYRQFTVSLYSNSDAYYFEFANQSSTDLMIELGTTLTAYESPTTHPVSWQTEAGTVYGGTVDLVTGVLTVAYAMVDLGTLT